MKKTLFSIGLFLLLLPILFGVTFTAFSPVLNNFETIFTADDIVCEWGVNIDSELVSQNITLYRNGAVYNNTFETSNFSTSISAPSSASTKNQVWMCEITISNTTDSITQSRTRTIENSAPTAPIVLDEGQQDIGTYYEVTEGETYTFNFSSTDPDNDPLEYRTSAAGFCETTDAINGMAECTPSFEDRVIGGITQFDNVLINITFWADDTDQIEPKSSGKVVTFNLTPINNLPFSNPVITNQTINVDEVFIYDITIADLEEDYPINISLLNIPAEIAPKSSLQTTSPTTARFIYNGTVPDFNDVNETGWPITLNFTDSRNATTLETFRLIIENIGRAPNLTLESSSIAPNAQGRYEVLQGETIQINFSASDEDFDDTHTYSYAMTRPTMNITTTNSSAGPTTNSTATLEFLARNSDVGNFSIEVTVEDSYTIQDVMTINFTVINVNDPPVIYEESSYVINKPTFNDNMNNVTAYIAAPFVFRINATDPDAQYGDTITFSDNTTIFAIDEDTGIISFTPTVTDFQNSPHIINITVTDSGGLQASKILNLTIGNNTAPYFDPDPLVPPFALPFICNQGTNCFYNISQYAFDNDTDDKIDFFEIQSPTITVPINATSGVINWTPTKQQVGTHTLNVTIIDTKGAPTSTTLELTINNTPSAPIITRADFSSQTIVENFTFSYELQAQDADFFLPESTEELTFTTNLSFVTIHSYEQGVGNAGNQTTAILEFEPTSALLGEHSINITVTDSLGLNESIVFTFEILARSCPPVIQQIRPFWDAGGFVNTSFTSIPAVSCNSLPPPTLAGSQTLEFTEDNTYTFDHVTTDDLTATNDLTIRWYYNDDLVASTSSYTRYFDYFSSGSHTLRLEIEDDMFEVTSYEWNLEIEDVARQPLLINPLRTPVDINQTTNLGPFLSIDIDDNDAQRFINPDDDLNSNNLLDSGETDTLMYSLVGSCGDSEDPFATIDVTGSVVSVTPKKIGVCDVQFRARHPASNALAILSNPVTFNITVEPEGEEDTQIESSPSGGSSAPSSAQPIPITRETEVPQPLNILSPRIVQLDPSGEMRIPFTVENNWDEPLNFIRLSAETNNSEVITTISSDLIETLQTNQSVELELQISNYRIGGNYEVELIAAVEEPEFTDTAVIFLASLEAGSSGESAQLLATFARDLLNENPECRELNELLQQADEFLIQGDYTQARRYIDSAINGCKHLIERTQERIERPNLIPNILFLNQQTLQVLLFSMFTIIFLISLSFVIYYHYTTREEDDI